LACAVGKRERRGRGAITTAQHNPLAIRDGAG
jgi:hypothetical protein